MAPTASLATSLATCSTTLTESLRPSGCSSYDPTQGGDGLTASPLSGNVWFNHWRNVSEALGEGKYDEGASESARAAAEMAAADGSGDYSYAEDAEFTAGRVIRQCVGFPPPYRLDRADDSYDALVVDDGLAGMSEDAGVDTTIRIACPTSCLQAVAEGQAVGDVRGSSDFYTDDSAVCMAAVHAGILSTDTAASAASPLPPAKSTSWSSSSSQESGEYDSNETVVVVIARVLPGNKSAEAPYTLRSGSDANNVSAGASPGDWSRGFSLELASPAEVTTQTIAGRPAGALGDGCGEVEDGQPPQEAVFRNPAGIDSWRAGNLTDEVR